MAHERQAILAIAAVFAFANAAHADGVLKKDAAIQSRFLDAWSHPGNYAAPMGVAFDGTNYWVGSGCSWYLNPPCLVKYKKNGNVLAEYPLAFELRSLFTDETGQLYATDSGFVDGIQVYRVTGGVPSLMYTLSAIPSVSEGVQSEFGVSNGILYGHDSGTIFTYDFATGIALGSFQLAGGSWGPGTYPSSVQLAVVGNLLLTYSSTGYVDAWGLDGSHRGTSYIGVTGVHPVFSFSFAEKRVWFANGTSFSDWDGSWLGYNIGLTP